MSEMNNNAARYEVVERYCPKCGQNVVMRRMFGNIPSFRCMNYENCQENKDSFCKEKDDLR